MITRVVDLSTRVTRGKQCDVEAALLNTHLKRLPSCGRHVRRVSLTPRSTRQSGGWRVTIGRAEDERALRIELFPRRTEAWRLPRNPKDEGSGFVRLAITADPAGMDSVLHWLDGLLNRWETESARDEDYSGAVYTP